MLILCFLAIGLNLKFDPISPNIPAKSSFTNLIVVHNYVNSGHLSTYYARSKLTNSFLIPNDKPIIKSVLIKCQVSFAVLVGLSLESQIMGK